METVKTSILSALTTYSKTKMDIEYVSYYLGLYLQTKQHYYCGIEEFLNVVDRIYMVNLAWSTEICIVGNNWWLQYEPKSKEWMFFTMPVKPLKYRIPLPSLIDATTLFESKFEGKHLID